MGSISLLSAFKLGLHVQLPSETLATSDLAATIASSFLWAVIRMETSPSNKTIIALFDRFSGNMFM